MSEELAAGQLMVTIIDRQERFVVMHMGMDPSGHIAALNAEGWWAVHGSEQVLGPDHICMKYIRFTKRVVPGAV